MILKKSIFVGIVAFCLARPGIFHAMGSSVVESPEEKIGRNSIEIDEWKKGEDLHQMEFDTRGNSLLSRVERKQVTFWENDSRAYVGNGFVEYHFESTLPAQGRGPRSNKIVYKDEKGKVIFEKDGRYRLFEASKSRDLVCFLEGEDSNGDQKLHIHNLSGNQSKVQNFPDKTLNWHVEKLVMYPEHKLVLAIFSNSSHGIFASDGRFDPWFIYGLNKKQGVSVSSVSVSVLENSIVAKWEILEDAQISSTEIQNFTFDGKGK